MVRTADPSERSAIIGSAQPGVHGPDPSEHPATAGIRMKVSEKGAVSIYGMGRFPVTLYKEQWLKLLDMSDDIRAFIAANETQLKTKNQNK
jgi:hypothetical protein